MSSNARDRYTNVLANSALNKRDWLIFLVVAILSGASFANAMIPLGAVFAVGAICVLLKPLFYQIWYINAESSGVTRYHLIACMVCLVLAGLAGWMGSVPGAILLGLCSLLVFFWSPWATEWAWFFLPGAVLGLILGGASVGLGFGYFLWILLGSTFLFSLAFHWWRNR